MKQISVGIALANTHGSVDTEQFYSFIESQKGDFETYNRAMPPPGSISVYATALDYMVLLNIAGSAASIASILWMAYEKFIVPKKKKDDNAGIVVIIQKDNGMSDQFWIGNTDKSKEIFIQSFSHKVNKIRNSELPGESTSHTNDKLRIESLWIRRK
jgi:hypothetical protein